MAIGGPEAIDAASLATAAQRRTAPKRLCCFARNGGAAGRGRKSRRRRCRIGDRGAADLRPDQPIEEAVWSGRRTETERRRNWRSLRNQGDCGWHIRPRTPPPGHSGIEQPSRALNGNDGHPPLIVAAEIHVTRPWPKRSVRTTRRDRSDLIARSYALSADHEMQGRGPVQLLVLPGRSDAFSPARGSLRSKRALPSPPTASTRSRRRRPRL